MKIRLLWPDILKLSAIFGVILLHAAAPFLVPFADSREWWIGNLYDSFTRWCVPMFVMVSGALILPAAEKTPLPKFLLGKVRKILVPFLAWSAIYFIYRIQLKGEELAPADFFRLLLAEPIYYHLWFVYMLIVLYLSAPAVSAFLNRAPRKHAWYLLLLWFIWTAVLPTLAELFALETYFTPDLDDYSALRLSGYFLLGHMLRDWQVRAAPQLIVLLLLFLLGGAPTMLGTYLMSRSRGEFSPFFYKYFSITVVAMAVSSFLFIKSIFHPRRQVTGSSQGQVRPSTPLLQMMGKGVFGIYLAHALVLELLRDGRLGFTIDHTSVFGLAVPLAAGLPIFALSILGLSLAAVLVICLIPVARGMLL